MKRRIYFDNAATSFPKPLPVYEAMDNYNRNIGASAGRGAYREVIESGNIIQQAREIIAKLINASDPNSIIMTFNCTDGLSLAIKGLITSGNCHIITTAMDHNSVLRPLNAMKDSLGIEVTFIPADSQGLIDPDDIQKAIKSNTALIASVHGSNVCGSLQDTLAIGKIAKQNGIPFLIDAAQSIGHIPFDVSAMNADMVAFPGHKGLLGPLGTGVLYIKEGFENRLRPVREGGTGSKSEDAYQPEFMPDRFESGSHNALGIAGLLEGVKFLIDKGLDNIRQHDKRLCQLFMERTDNIKNLTVYGPKDIKDRIGVFSVSVKGKSPAELAGILEQKYGLLTRPGIHCAPYAHQAIGSFDLGGTTRFSTGIFMTDEDMIYAANSLIEICSQQ